MSLAGLAAAWEAVKVRRGITKFPKCSSTHCRRRGCYLCRSCGRPFCGHCAGHTIRPDDVRSPVEERATCSCLKCRLADQERRRARR